MANLRRVFKRRFSRKQDIPNRLPAVLGDGYGHVNDTATGENFVFARVSGKIATVFNTRVPARDGLRVWVGFDPLEPGLYQVLSTRSNSIGVTFGGGGTVPASYYSWGGSDPLYVQLRQFMPFRPWVTNSDMILHLYRGFILTSTGPKFVDVQTTDLTTYIPTAYDTAALVLITIDTSGALVVTDGADVSPIADLVTTTTMTNLPAIPANTAYVIAAVRVFRDGIGAPQTIIYEPMSVSGGNEVIRNDLSDLRLMNDVSSGGLALNIHGATAKTTPVDADEFPMADSAASWILKKVTWVNIKATLKTHFDTLYAFVAGNGLGVSGLTLSVNVDGSTIEINTDTLRVKAGGIGANEIAATAVTAGTYGAQNLVPQIVIDADGRITSAVDVSVSSAGQVSGVTRWSGASGQTTFDLPDYAEYVLWVHDNGLGLDPFEYTLSTDRSQIVLDTALGQAAVIDAGYVVAQI